MHLTQKGKILFLESYMKILRSFRAVVFLGSLSSVSGAIIGEVSTDGAGQFTAGGWSGDGTIGANAGHLSSGTSLMVDNTTGGVLSLGRTANTANGVPYGGIFGSGVSPSFTNVTATMSVGLGVVERLIFLRLRMEVVS